MKPTTGGLPSGEWRKIVARFEKPSIKRSVWQIVNSVVPYFGVLYLMYLSLDVSIWLTLALSVPAALFLIRIFIIFHDCGHGSFFKNRKANAITGFFTALMTFTPAYYWSHQHARHHASSGDLDNRGFGDMWTLTVDEYRARSRGQRLWYRVYRHPAFFLLFGSFFTFFIRHRYWISADNPRQRRSTMHTNIALAIIVTVCAFTIGIKAYILLQVFVMFIAGMAGIWLFYVQHQYEGVYWERHEDWDYFRQAIEGSSFYNLPRLLHWFTGNIGFHHVHHLSSRIPNYYLRKCHESHPMFRDAREITLRTSLKCANFRLWDEKRRELVGFAGVDAG